MVVVGGMYNQIKQGFARSHDPKLVDELLEAHTQIKRNYYLGGLRLTEVEGGRFCEAAFRLLQERITGQYTPLGRELNTEKLILTLANLPFASQPDSVRLHIPRALRVIFDIRNNRDAAHLADGIDPNLQDATLVAGIVDWVLAEFVRLYHKVPPNEAQRIVDGLVTRAVPAIQDFGGFLKVLNPKLTASERILVLLYQRGDEGATYDELASWSRPSAKKNLGRTLSRLVQDHDFLHFDGQRYFITRAGMKEVERRKLFEMS